MLSTFPVAVLAGALLGCLAGLGIGGGSLLILWLTLILGVDTQTARSINLLFFLPCAVVACYFRWKQGYIDWKRIIPGMIAGCIASALFSWIGAGFDLTILKKLFGGLLIITGIREVLYKPRKA